MSAIKQIGLLFAILLVTAFRTSAPAQGITGLTYATHHLHQSSDKSKTIVDIAYDSASAEEDQDTADEGLSLFADAPTLLTFFFSPVCCLSETGLVNTSGNPARVSRPYYLLFHSLRIPSC